MRLEVLERLVATLDDEWRSPVADAMLARWAHDAGSARYLRGSANFVFVFRQGGEPFFLRFADVSERSVPLVEAELAFVRFVGARGIQAAQPIPSLEGGLVEQVESPYGTFVAVVFEALAGEEHEVDSLSMEQFAVWGEALGQLHQASQRYNDLGERRPSWRTHLEWVGRRLPEAETAARRELARLWEALEALPVREDSFGMIHFDFELDNLLWREGEIGVVDFDDCAHYWFAADIAFALRDLWGDSVAGVNLRDPRLLAFVEGYRRVRAMPEEALASLSLFLRCHQLFTFTRLLRSLEGGVDRLEWLRGRLEEKAAFYRRDFGGR
jgi:Ser/Thr protein kinase RdoA (MazF antagonist)